jgi:hypothetical protein
MKRDTRNVVYYVVLFASAISVIFHLVPEDTPTWLYLPIGILVGAVCTRLAE